MPRTSLSALVLLTAPAISFAQESPVEMARRDLIARAEQARAEGDHARALDLGTRAGQIRMTPSLRLLIAQEHESLGQTLEAFDDARRCAREATAETGLRNGPAIVARCAELESSLGQRLGLLTVRVAPSAGLTVVMGAQPLPPPLWNVSIPVLPGALRITATSADGRRVVRDVTVAPGGAEEVAFELAPPRRTTTERPGLRATSLPGHGPGAGPWIVGSLGLASFGAAAALWALHVNAVTDRDSACDASGCDPVALTHDDRARTFTTLTNATLGLGLAAVGAAVLWYVLAPRGSSETPPSAATEPRLGFAVLPDGAAATVGGTL